MHREDHASSALLARLDPVLRWRYLILTTAAYAFMFQHIRGTGIDWSYFADGSQLIFGQHPLARPLAGGLQLYVNYPYFQIGPLALVAAAPLRLAGGHHSRELAAVVMTAMGPALVWVIERTASFVHRAPSETDERLRKLSALLGGLLVVQAWANLATIYAHLDDALALALLVLSVSAVAHRRPIWCGVALGAAVAAKPWGLVALPLLLAFDGVHRRKAAGATVLMIALAWGPFVIAAPDTLHAIEPQVRVVSDSVLHLFGVPLMDAQAWMRWLQLIASLVIGTIAVRRGQWPAVLLVGIATRVALDPQVFLYYGSGLVVAALVWDLLRSSRTLPLATLFTFVLLNDSYTTVGNPTARATLRLVATAVTVLVALAWRSRDGDSTQRDEAVTTARGAPDTPRETQAPISESSD